MRVDELSYEQPRCEVTEVDLQCTVALSGSYSGGDYPKFDDEQDW